MRRLMVVLAAAMLWCVSAQAQEWPSSQVTVIVPFSAGSTPDSLARILAEGLQERLKQPFIVENRTGPAATPARRRWRRRHPTDTRWG
jgi:tripartite-type tricarboxylate transporter receptor subunit TctC